MWTNETKLIYSTERWPHNQTTTATAQVSSTMRVYQMMTVNNKKKKKVGEMKRKTTSRWTERKNEGGSSRRIYMRPSRSLALSLQSESRNLKKRNERNGVATADPLTPDTFLQTDYVELCAAAAALLLSDALCNFQPFGSCPCFSLHHCEMFRADFWIDTIHAYSHSCAQPKQKANIVDFDFEICMWRNSAVRFVHAMRCEASTSHIHGHMKWVDLSMHKILNRTHRNSFGCHQSRLIKPKIFFFGSGWASAYI